MGITYSTKIKTRFCAGESKDLGEAERNGNAEKKRG